MWHERLVPLIEHGASGLALFEGASRGSLQIDDAAAEILGLADATPGLCHLRAALDRPGDGADVETPTDGAKGLYRCGVRSAECGVRSAQCRRCHRCGECQRGDEGTTEDQAAHRLEPVHD